MDEYTNNAGRFRAEVGNVDADECDSSRQPVHLENPEKETRWYFKYFLGKLHQVYGGQNADKEPFVMAVVVSNIDNHTIQQYRCILWHKTGSQKLCIPYNASNPLTAKKLLNFFNIHRCEKGPKEIINPEVQKDLLTLEEQEGSVNFKFGVLYCKEGQLSDEDMYNNEHASEAFWKFAELLGDRMKLKGFDHFKGGLDTKNNTTGEESLYTIYEGHEIMFHVSPLLPYSLDNKQQIERKRHIGNDIVNIIFVEQPENQIVNQPSWRPSMMKTHFTHIFAIVTFNKDKQGYRLNVYAEETVPLFGPPLPSPPEFSDLNEFRDFLLVKLINGEKAAFHSPVFAQKRMRTLDMLISNTLEMYSGESISVLNRRALSDIVVDQSNDLTTTKEQARNDEFMNYGQILKVNIIIRGDAPTSKITSGNLRKAPWQPKPFKTEFKAEILCGDTWGEKLIVGSDEGTFILEEQKAPILIVDRSVDVKQLEVIESVNALIIRHDKGKESRVSFLRLTVPESAWPIDKNQIKEFNIEKSKGCHLFAVNKALMQPLRLVVAIHRRICIYQWRFNVSGASLSSWNQFTNTDDNASFQYLRELPTFEPAQVITVVETTGKEHICIGYKNQFDLIDEKRGDTIHLYKSECSKDQVIAAIDICADDEPELLLCLNRSCHFQKLVPHDPNNVNNSVKEFDFLWSFQPNKIVIAFPYVVAFTENSVEIRLIVNGSLVHTMIVPNCILIASRADLFFTTTAHNLCSGILNRPDKSSDKLKSDSNESDSARNSGVHEVGLNSSDFAYLYRIPLSELSSSHCSHFGGTHHNAINRFKHSRSHHTGSINSDSTKTNSSDSQSEHLKTQLSSNES